MRTQADWPTPEKSSEFEGTTTVAPACPAALALKATERRRQTSRKTCCRSARREHRRPPAASAGLGQGTWSGLRLGQEAGTETPQTATRTCPGATDRVRTPRAH
eukprot:7615025-Alexandrium_andersonii.AAC.1